MGERDEVFKDGGVKEGFDGIGVWKELDGKKDWR